MNLRTKAKLHREVRRDAEGVWVSQRLLALSLEAAKGGDHGGIVGAQPGVGAGDGQGEGGGELAAKFGVGCHAPGDDDAGRGEFFISQLGLANNGFDGDALKARCNVGLLGRGEALRQLCRGKIIALTDLGLGEAQDGCLEAGEAEVVLAHVGFGEGEGGGVAMERGFGDRGAARVGEAENLGHLVKSFANGVVLGLAEQGVVEVAAEQGELAVAAGDDDG